MIPDEKLAQAVESEVKLLGYELLKLDLISRGRRKVLRLFIDSPGGSVTVEDCVKVSKAIGFVIDGEELVQGSYNLEVSSPGIDRPLVKPEHFERFKGHGARVEFSTDGGGRKTIIGKIKIVDGSAVVISSDEGEASILFDRIVKANLHGENWDISGGRREKRRGGRGRRRKRF
jgi:ribosome maturation factor RimP